MEKSLLNGNIFLIGFMGTGKSTIACELKKLLGCELVDMDQMIVEKQGMPISKIFEEHGEDYFRDIETNTLIELQKSTELLISCGGGVVVREENASHMRKSGRIVLLTARPETIYKRVKDSKARPILNGNMNVEFIQGLLEKREAKYAAAADITIATDDKSIAQICDEIIAELS